MKAALLFATLATAGASSASFASFALFDDELDPRWAPWLGCWELVDDERREPLVGEADPTKGKDVPLRGFVCLNPAADGSGVTVTTVANGEPFLEETLIADGEKNPSAKGQCNGWQRTEWSEDGHRLFTDAELTCDENRQLKVSGLSMMAPRSTWLDIQIVESEAGRAVLIRRYRPADGEDVADLGDSGLLATNLALGQSQSRQRYEISAPLSADDIAEAASKVAPEALEAAVLENEDGFDLDAETLIRLDDAGVRSGLIDLMVALSYPDQFVVESGTGDAGGGFALPGTFYGGSFPYTYGYGAPYYVAPFSYYYWYAPPHPRYVVRPIAVREVRQGLVSNRGYAQVSPRSSTGRKAVPRSGSSSSSVSGSSRSSGSRGTVTRGGGYSRGGSSGRSATRKKN